MNLSHEQMKEEAFLTHQAQRIAGIIAPCGGGYVNRVRIVREALREIKLLDLSTCAATLHKAGKRVGADESEFFMKAARESFAAATGRELESLS